LTTFAAGSLNADLIHESMMAAVVAYAVNSSSRLLFLMPVYRRFAEICFARNCRHPRKTMSLTTVCGDRSGGAC